MAKAVQLPQRDEFGRRPYTARDLQVIGQRLDRLHAELHALARDVGMTLQGLDPEANRLETALVQVVQTKRTIRGRG